MDEAAYTRYIARSKEADEIYRTIRELYGWLTPWDKAYFMAIKDGILSKDDKKLVKEFHPIRR